MVKLNIMTALQLGKAKTNVAQSRTFYSKWKDSISLLL